jgi:hypothetical protein
MKKIRLGCFLLAVAVPALGGAQTLSIFDAAYRVEADAQSGASFGTQTWFNNSVGPQQSFFDRADAFANEGTSSVHSFASVEWNCTPTDLDIGLVACWESFDNGAGNSGHMLSRLFLGINVDQPNFVTIAAAYDLPNSWAEVDIWNGSNWVLMLNRTQVPNYAGIWAMGDYRIRAERHYDPVGSSTGCEPWNFHMHAQAVPEPATVFALAGGLVVLLRQRKRAL